jgi:hypothetical protein
MKWDLAIREPPRAQIHNGMESFREHAPTTSLSVFGGRVCCCRRAFKIEEGGANKWLFAGQCVCPFLRALSRSP